jgi:hypothetical protein
VPLNRYFQTLVPTLSSNNQDIKSFSLPAFLNQLKIGPNPLSFRQKGLSSKTRVESDFYTRFCMSQTFSGWLSSKMISIGSVVNASRQLKVMTLPAVINMERTSSEVRLSSDGSTLASAE